jgi:hypothetical protein
MTYQIEVILCLKTHNALMEHAQKLGGGRTLGDSHLVIVESDEAADIVLKATLDRLKEKFLVSFAYIDENNVWWNTEVDAITDGTFIVMLSDYIKASYPKLNVLTVGGKIMAILPRKPE